jgi:hypothetical protein
MGQLDSNVQSPTTEGNPKVTRVTASSKSRTVFAVSTM